MNCLLFVLQNGFFGAFKQLDGSFTPVFGFAQQQIPVDPEHCTGE